MTATDPPILSIVTVVFTFVPSRLGLVIVSRGVSLTWCNELNVTSHVAAVDDCSGFVTDTLYTFPSAINWVLRKDGEDVTLMVDVGPFEPKDRVNVPDKGVEVLGTVCTVAAAEEPVRVVSDTDSVGVDR
eukprot:gene786-biopygen372